jgi:hypothetical protein
MLARSWGFAATPYVLDRLPTHNVAAIFSIPADRACMLVPDIVGLPRFWGAGSRGYNPGGSGEQRLQP